MLKTHGEAVQLLYNSIPYPEQIKNLDLSEDRAIYFTWRSNQFKIEFNSKIMAYTVKDNCLVGSDFSILLGELLNRQYLIEL